MCNVWNSFGIRALAETKCQPAILRMLQYAFQVSTNNLAREHWRLQSGVPKETGAAFSLVYYACMGKEQMTLEFFFFFCILLLLFSILIHIYMWKTIQALEMSWVFKISYSN